MKGHARRTCDVRSTVSSTRRFTSSASMRFLMFTRWFIVTCTSSSADEHDRVWYLKPMRIKS